MFGELLKLVKKAEEDNATFLKKHYQTIEDSRDWKDLVAKETTKADLSSLRQDNFVKPDYSMAQLQKMSENAGRDLTAVYDTSGYLSKLMLTAYALDEIFHDTLREIFDIDIATGRSKDGKMLYHPFRFCFFAVFDTRQVLTKSPHRCFLARKTR